MISDSNAHKQQVEEAVSFLRSRLPIMPEVLIQLGTGLGNLVEAMDKRLSIPYEKIPG
ncbi:MAG: purine-nucleoside phosphorylase, partial [Candidatus Electrothrix sp. EH2]|nr:purine-nucleoside phosphorylase [Candidatus Electrothrix sp. EH2]